MKTNNLVTLSFNDLVEACGGAKIGQPYPKTVRLIEEVTEHAKSCVVGKWMLNRHADGTYFTKEHLSALKFVFSKLPPNTDKFLFYGLMYP